MKTLKKVYMIERTKSNTLGSKKHYSELIDIELTYHSLTNYNVTNNERRRAVMLDDTEMLTVEEVAKQLKVHIRTVRKWIQDGELIAMDIGRGYRIRKSDLEAFIKSRQTDKRKK
jgi:excisionase family DNA binding protein